jgi:hypothetical protein
MTQGVLPLQYPGERSSAGMTALAGRPTSLEGAAVSGLTASMERSGRAGASDRDGLRAVESGRWGGCRGPAGAGRR